VIVTLPSLLEHVRENGGEVRLVWHESVWSIGFYPADGAPHFLAVRPESLIFDLEHLDRMVPKAEAVT
jgi:hypothetical protein